MHPRAASHEAGEHTDFGPVGKPKGVPRRPFRSDFALFTVISVIPDGLSPILGARRLGSGYGLAIPE
jgi:hypothetical protein